MVCVCVTSVYRCIVIIGETACEQLRGDKRLRGVPYRLQRGGGGKEERSLGVWASGGKRIKQIQEEERGEAERLDEMESG